MTFLDYSEKVKPVQDFGIRDDAEGKEQNKAAILATTPSDSIASIPTKELPAFLDYENKKDWNAIVLSDSTPRNCDKKCQIDLYVLS